MTSTFPARRAGTRRRRLGFTLIELLVVISILVILFTLLMPALAAAREAGRKAVCLSNLRQIGVAIQAYADDYGGKIPYGPKAPPFTSPASFYPSTGAPTSLVSLRSGAPVALGLLLEQHLSRESKVLFCPANDQPLNASAELAKVGSSQAQGSFFYRHAGTTRLFDDPNANFVPEHVQLESLGLNRNGVPIRALAIDAMFACPPDLAAFGVKPHTHHRQKFANILFADGHVSSRPNLDNRFLVDLRDYAEIHAAFEKILRVLEQADVEP